MSIFLWCIATGIAWSKVPFYSAVNTILLLNVSLLYFYNCNVTRYLFTHLPVGEFIVTIYFFTIVCVY